MNDTKTLAPALRIIARAMPEFSPAREAINFAAARLEELERELAEATIVREGLVKTADKLEEDKEYNASLCESLRADWEAERALADRLAASLDIALECFAEGQSIAFDDAHTAERALKAWKEARRE